MQPLWIEIFTPNFQVWITRARDLPHSVDADVIADILREVRFHLRFGEGDSP